MSRPATRNLFNAAFDMEDACNDAWDLNPEMFEVAITDDATSMSTIARMIHRLRFWSPRMRLQAVCVAVRAAALVASVPVHLRSGFPLRDPAEMNAVDAAFNWTAHDEHRDFTVAKAHMMMSDVVGDDALRVCLCAGLLTSMGAWRAAPNHAPAVRYWFEGMRMLFDPLLARCSSVVRPYLRVADLAWVYVARQEPGLLAHDWTYRWFNEVADFPWPNHVKHAIDAHQTAPLALLWDQSL